MSVLKKVRAAQTVKEAEFVWNFSDTMLDTGDASKDFGAATIASTAFDVIALPPGSVVVGGSLAIETAFDTAGYDVIVGDSVDTDRYMATADVKAVGYTALLTPGYRNTSGLPIRVTFASDDVCTTGKATLRVLYVIANRADEVTD